jgi:ABC-type sugar transport system ATPase subunit
MLGEPKLIIFDEPTSALGVKESLAVTQLIRRLSSEGTAVIVVSHRLQGIVDTTSRVLLMKYGQISKVFLSKEVTVARLFSEICA